MDWLYDRIVLVNFDHSDISSELQENAPRLCDKFTSQKLFA